MLISITLMTWSRGAKCIDPAVAPPDQIKITKGATEIGGRPRRAFGQDRLEATSQCSADSNHEQAAGEVPESSRTIRIRVLNESGTPESHATVAVRVVRSSIGDHPSVGAPDVSPCNALGLADVSIPEGKEFVVHAWTDHLAAVASPTEYQLRRGSMSIVLANAITVSGVVVEAVSARPLRNARVRCELPRARVTLETTSDQDGRFSVAPIPAEGADRYGQLVVIVEARDHRSKELNLWQADARSPLRVELFQARTASGRLVRPDGLPVAGFQIRHWDDGVIAWTQADGRFEIALPRQRCVIVALPMASSLDSAPNESLTWPARDDGPVIVREFAPEDPGGDVGDVVVYPSTLVTGSVRDDSGQAVPDAIVMLSMGSFDRTDDGLRMRVPGFVVDICKADSLGGFRLRSGALGPRDLIVVSPADSGYEQQRTLVPRLSESDRVVNVLLTGGPAVYFEFLDSTFRKRVEVKGEVRFRLNGRDVWKCVGSLGSRFTVDDLIEGRYEAIIELDGYAIVQLSEIEVSRSRGTACPVVVTPLR